jgi:hypothetical protein
LPPGCFVSPPPMLCCSRHIGLLLFSRCGSTRHFSGWAGLKKSVAKYSGPSPVDLQSSISGSSPTAIPIHRLLRCVSGAPLRDRIPWAGPILAIEDFSISVLIRSLFPSRFSSIFLFAARFSSSAFTFYVRFFHISSFFYFIILI